MPVLKRAKRTTAQLARAQRRIWLVQTLFWPLVVVSTVVTAAIWVALRKKKHHTVAVDQHVGEPEVSS